MRGAAGQCAQCLHFLRLAQLLLELFALLLGPNAIRDVLNLGHKVPRRAIRIPSQGNVQLHPDDVARLVQIPLIHLIIIDLLIQHLPHQFQVRLAIIGVRDGLKVGGQQFAARVANDLAQRRVNLQPAAIRSDDGHADGRTLHGGAKFVLAQPQRFFNMDAFGDELRK